MKSELPYIPHTEDDIKKMCEAIGIASVEELLKPIPASLRVDGVLDIKAGLSEQETLTRLKELSEKNSTEKASFLGGGSYNHYSPSVVDHLLLRSEFFTSYTPYQPELSQGTLQAIFEYQTLICQLTGMEISNSSLYDGASATAEAVLMARRLTRRGKVVVSSALHPEYRDTIETYLLGFNEEPTELAYCTEAGSTIAESTDSVVDEETSCLVVQHPNFFGSIEDIKTLAERVHAKGALLIVVTTEALSLALLKPPGELGADIAVGEAQSFGNPMSFGGPYIGYMATKQKHIRQLPGRIIGETKDKNNKRSFCLTFATREQHIRREKATSNICTNQGLSALASAIYLNSLGKAGLMDLARLNLSKAEYLKNNLSEIAGITATFTAPTFNEFTITIDGDAQEFLKQLSKKKIIGGLGLKRFYPSLNNQILIAVTEMNSKAELDSFIETASAIMGNL